MSSDATPCRRLTIRSLSYQIGCGSFWKVSTYFTCQAISCDGGWLDAWAGERDCDEGAASGVEGPAMSRPKQGLEAKYHEL